MAVADAALGYLDKNGLLLSSNDSVKNPNEENALSQLTKFHQHGFISDPQYISEETGDENGNLAWYVEVHVMEPSDYWEGTFSRKKGRNPPISV